MKSWYVVNTKPHSEFKVINYLNSKNITVFMPKLLVSRSHARQVKKVLRPLFPSYFFVLIVFFAQIMPTHAVASRRTSTQTAHYFLQLCR